MAKVAKKLPVKTEKSQTPAASEHWAPFEALHREIDRLFADFHPFGWRNRPSRSVFDLDFPRFDVSEWTVAPAMDLVEKNGSYEITAELPGIDEKNVDVKLSNNTLTIKGEKKEEKEEKEKDYYLAERRFGSFQRSFQLPEGIDADKIDAHFAKGVLTITLPKTPETQKSQKKIEVKAA